jgi:hypothetical protein
VVSDCSGQPGLGGMASPLDSSQSAGGVLGVRLFRSSYVDLKAGWGLYEYRRLVAPKYASQPQDSYHFGLSLYQAFK